jgi:hypothetical protein
MRHATSLRHNGCIGDFPPRVAMTIRIQVFRDDRAADHRGKCFGDQQREFDRHPGKDDEYCITDKTRDEAGRLA